jgi:hypothetical protein
MSNDPNPGHDARRNPPPHPTRNIGDPQGAAQPLPSVARAGALTALRAGVTVGTLLLDSALWGLNRSDVFGPGQTGAVITAALTVVPGAAVMRFALRDSWGVAIFRAGLLSLVAAIQSPLPRLLVLVVGLGALGALQRATAQPARDAR